MKTGWKNPRQHFGRALAPPARPLDASTVEGFMRAADARAPSEVPTIYDLLALCDVVAHTRPFQAKSAKKTLHWLMEQAERINPPEQGWDHPWRRN